MTPTASNPTPDSASSALNAERPLSNAFVLLLLRGVGYFLGLLVLLTLTFLILGIAPVPALQALWVGAFGDGASGHLYPLSETLLKTSPLLLCGLGIVVAWRVPLSPNQSEFGDETKVP